MRVLLAIVFCLGLIVFLINEAAKRSYPAQAAECSPGQTLTPDPYAKYVQGAPSSACLPTTQQAPAQVSQAAMPAQCGPGQELNRLAALLDPGNPNPQWCADVAQPAAPPPVQAQVPTSQNDAFAGLVSRLTPSVQPQPQPEYWRYNDNLVSWGDFHTYAEAVAYCKAYFIKCESNRFSTVDCSETAAVRAFPKAYVNTCSYSASPPSADERRAALERQSAPDGIGTAVEAANRGRAAMGLPVESEPPPAERTDVYEKALQILSGEHLTPLN